MTPLMRQYHEIKHVYPDSLLFFQVGDFYELFFKDAQTAAQFLGITLTSRGKHLEEDIPLCGVPVHAVHHYLIKLVQGGFTVAVCDQLEPPRPGTVVKRGVTQVFTPATLTDSQLLDEKSASYLLTLHATSTDIIIIATEVLTAQLVATVIPAHEKKLLISECARFMPDEILVTGPCAQAIYKQIASLGYFTRQYDRRDDNDAASYWAKGPDNRCKHIPAVHVHEVTVALISLYGYLQKNSPSALSQLGVVRWYTPIDFLQMDAATQRHLELVENSQDGGRKNTLLSIVDGASTAMGSRLIKKWILRPLMNQDAIEQRLAVVERWIGQPADLAVLSQQFKAIGDIERVVGRIALERGTLTDFIALRMSLEVLPSLRAFLATYNSLPLIERLGDNISAFASLHALLTASINTDPEHDWIIKPRFDQELDRLRDLVENSTEQLIALEQAEQKKTGINSLKIRYNQVHGYYIEITKLHREAIPDYYIHTQTLTGKIRFTCAALRQLEVDINQARSHIERVEREQFARVKKEVAGYIPELRRCAQALSYIDALSGFANIAYTSGYVRPSFSSMGELYIEEGCHPVLKDRLQNQFIANDTVLNDTQSTCIITGPNMGGKSTYLRHVALLNILAQSGSFIPAKKATLPLFDRIFTRIGAADNVAEGKSTFLVEMEETALICTEATKRSLVILDEVGRGTSTFDGLAIAQAVVEYIHMDLGARCLFATHYHELTELTAAHVGIVNLHAASQRTDQGMLLLHKIIPGVAGGSFGIEVAQQAQLPDRIIERARVLISELTTVQTPHEHAAQKTSLVPSYQFGQTSPIPLGIIQKILEINLDEVSPRGALDILCELQQVAHQDEF